MKFIEIIMSLKYSWQGKRIAPFAVVVVDVVVVVVVVVAKFFDIY